MAYQLLKPTQLAEASEPQACAGPRGLPATFSCSPNLTGTDVGTIQFTTDEGVTWNDLTIGTILQQLSVDDTMVTVYGTGIYRVNRSTSATLSDVSISTPLSP